MMKRSHMPVPSKASISGAVLKFLVELLLVGLAVFLGLLANQWREGRQHRELATATLHYFHQDAKVNQKAIADEREYHQTLVRELEAFLQSDVPKTQASFNAQVHFRGVRPIVFEHTARDLALATQSLSYFTPQLSYALSQVYTRQQAFQTLEDSFLQSIYNPTALANPDATGLATALDMYMNDVNAEEPALLKLYAELLPEIDKAETP